MQLHFFSTFCRVHSAVLIGRGSQPRKHRPEKLGPFWSADFFRELASLRGELLLATSGRGPGGWGLWGVLSTVVSSLMRTRFWHWHPIGHRTRGVRNAAAGANLAPQQPGGACPWQCPNKLAGDKPQKDGSSNLVFPSFR